jgi:hypothetical protein
MPGDRVICLRILKIELYSSPLQISGDRVICLSILCVVIATPHTSAADVVRYYKMDIFVPVSLLRCAATCHRSRATRITVSASHAVSHSGTLYEYSIRFEGLNAVTMKYAAFWDKKQFVIHRRHYVSSIDLSQLMLCKIWGYHDGDYEEFRLLDYKNPVRTSQETHYVSATKLSRLMLCKIWSFHEDDNEKCRLMRYGTAWFLLERPWWWRWCVPPKRRFLTLATRHHIPEDGILPCIYIFHYITHISWSL